MVSDSINSNSYYNNFARKMQQAELCYSEHIIDKIIYSKFRFR